MWLSGSSDRSRSGCLESVSDVASRTISTYVSLVYVTGVRRRKESAMRYMRTFTTPDSGCRLALCGSPVSPSKTANRICPYKRHRYAPLRNGRSLGPVRYSPVKTGARGHNHLFPIRCEPPSKGAASASAIARRCCQPIHKRVARAMCIGWMFSGAQAQSHRNAVTRAKTASVIGCPQRLKIGWRHGASYPH